MSSRQRSFFDQDHGDKAKARYRPQWNRTRSADNVPQRNSNRLNATVAAPPIDPSSQAKSKLRAFQFGGDAHAGHSMADADKENAGIISAPITDLKALGKASQDVWRNNADDDAHSRSAPPPSTPATRLPLADLIGDTDEHATRNPQLVISPEEHVQWQHYGENSTPRDRPSRKRKRAQSISSATSSPEQPFDLVPLQKSLKTPDGDAKKAAGFAHLIDKSSPHSSATAGSVGGLRRWASCGAEFPSATKPKRRRTNGAFRESNAVDPEEALEGEEAGAKAPSKLDWLVEKMQETVANPARETVAAGPSSSSPLPEGGRNARPDCISPLQRRKAPSSNAKVDGPNEKTTTAETPPVKASASSQARTSSDFGDVDIDLDAIESMEMQEAVKVAQPTIPETSGPREGPASHNAAPNAERKDTSSLTAPNMGGPGEVDDFEDYGDLSEADMEAAASMYDVSKPEKDRTGASQALHSSGTSEALAAAAEVAEGLDTAQPATVIHIDSDDEFGDDDIDDEQFAAAEAIATQAMQQGSAGQTNSDPQLRAIQRYRVTKVAEGDYLDERGCAQPEKVLLVEDERTNLNRAIYLRQAWIDTPCAKGSYVHVIGQFSKTGECIINNSQNSLILHPDHLVSATTVANAFGCLRRAVLEIRVKATSDSSPPTLYGHMLHRLFQDAMTVNRWDRNTLDEIVKKILPQYYETMAEIGLNENQVREHLRSKYGEMRNWASSFVRARPAKESTVRDRNGKQVSLSINKLLDVEERVESPKYGLKGMIDSTVQVRMVDEHGHRTLTMPFELKTGKRTNEAHQAQTVLYTLLTSDRYDLDVFYGILFYLETGEMRRIPAIRHELLQMIMKRNELAGYMRDRLQLPPVLDRSHLCGSCYAQTTCFIYHKLTENGDGSSFTAVKKKFDDLVRNLKSKHQAFFTKWDDLLTKEESESMRFRRELWTMLSHEREKLGRCFAHVVLEPSSVVEQVDASRINRFEYTLKKHGSSSGHSFTESQITVGEAIVISDEKGHFALAMGYVTRVRKKHITVSVDRRLQNSWVRRPGFDAITNQDFVGIMEVADDEDKSTNLAPGASQDETEPTIYRLDKDEFGNGMATVRNNLVAIMDDNVFKAADLRALIIEDHAPVFKHAASALEIPGSMQMNSDQEAAVAKVMAAEDYALVLGMPGTGKTTTIAHIIRALVARGKSVLLASYTHTAVDNILLKIRDTGFPILRIGPIAKVHPEVQVFATLAARQKDSLQEVMESWHRPPIVATTCLGIRHALFTQRTFDYCIVDEASQITLPVCLGPIRLAKTFVLVGDHFQLPPLVQNKEAIEGGYDVSLFRLLSERHPEAVTNLEHQYRMAADVMLLANRLIYSGRLKCGNESTAARMLNAPDLAALEHFHYRNSPSRSQHKPLNSYCHGTSVAQCHLGMMLRKERRVLFLDTDRLLPEAAETLNGMRITNSLEARLTTQCVSALLACGVSPSDIGVITFYRSQLALLRQSFRHSSHDTSSHSMAGSIPPTDNLAAVEMHTADKFQGRDKEAIIVSFVRSNDAFQVGELLRDWRRINVAVTRARSKLVLIGSKKTLASGGNEVLKGLISVCQEQGWMVELTIDALEGHVAVDGVVSQTTQSSASGRHTAGPGTSFKSSSSAVDRERVYSDKARKPSSPPQGRERKPRRVLGEIEGRNTLPPKPVAGTKLPEKRGVINQKSLLKGKGVIQDVFNDVL